MINMSRCISELKTNKMNNALLILEPQDDYFYLTP